MSAGKLAVAAAGAALMVALGAAGVSHHTTADPPAAQTSPCATATATVQEYVYYVEGFTTFPNDLPSEAQQIQAHYGTLTAAVAAACPAGAAPAALP